MIDEGLLEKSEDNIKTGDFAEKNKYYDAAISRYYYAIYQKIIYISKKNGFYSKPLDGDSHITTITTFNSKINKKLKPEDNAKLAVLLRLKQLRVKADYHESRITDNKTYNLTFKYFYNEIIGILNKLIKEG